MSSNFSRVNKSKNSLSIFEQLVLETEKGAKFLNRGKCNYFDTSIDRDPPNYITKIFEFELGIDKNFVI